MIEFGTLSLFRVAVQALSARGGVPAQLAVLGVTPSLAGLVFNTALGACTGMIGLALRLLLIDRPSKGF